MVPADDRLPIDRKDLDISSLITLDENENTIQFDVEGYYKITAQGIIAVENIANAYELVNVGKNDIYLNTLTLDNIQSGSYFTNSLVTIIIEYLGRQGA